MTEIKEAVYEALDKMGIPCEHTDHPLAHTMADCEEPARRLGAVMPKNLFLTPRNKSAYYLCLVAPDSVFKTAVVSKQIGASRLSFAGEDELWSHMRTRPGAISPMGLIFPESRDVILLVDDRLRSLDRLAFHPCEADQSLAVSGADFFGKFLPALGRSPIWINMGEGQA